MMTPFMRTYMGRRLVTLAGETEWARHRPGGSGLVLLVFRISCVLAGLST